MSSPPLHASHVDRETASVPRVRHQARDAATVMAFSAFTSVALAMLLLLSTALLGR